MTRGRDPGSYGAVVLLGGGMTCWEEEAQLGPQPVRHPASELEPAQPTSCYPSKGDGSREMRPGAIPMSLLSSPNEAKVLLQHS